MEEISPTPMEAESQEMHALIRDSNTRLVEAGSESAEQSFGLSCLLGGLVVVGLIAVLYFAGALNVILASIILVLGLVGLTGVVTLSASFARAHRVRETYRLLIGPEIERYLLHQQISRAEFYQAADEILGEDAPLRAHLLSPPQKSA